MLCFISVSRRKVSAAGAAKELVGSGLSAGRALGKSCVASHWSMNALRFPCSATRRCCAAIAALSSDCAILRCRTWLELRDSKNLWMTGATARPSTMAKALADSATASSMPVGFTSAAAATETEVGGAVHAGTCKAQTGNFRLLLSRGGGSSDWWGRGGSRRRLDDDGRLIRLIGSSSRG